MLGGFKGTAWTHDNPVVKVLELITIKPGTGSYLELKNRLLLDYIARYGRENVPGDRCPQDNDLLVNTVVENYFILHFDFQK